MKLETFLIHKTDSVASLVPHLSPDMNGNKRNVGFFIKGRYFPPKKANNLYNRTNKNLPPRLPKAPLDRIMQGDFPNGDIPCYVIDRGADIEIIVE